MRSYKDIHNILLDRIKSGEWQPGALVPAEADLAREFGCTRVTVNRAMQALADSGLLERRRKAGTRVVQRMTRDAVFQIPIVRHEIEQRGGNYKYLLINREEVTPPQKVKAEMKLSGDEAVLHVLSLHFADGEPYQLEDRWIDINTVPQARNEPFDTLSPNEWLLREIPYTNAEHVFRAAQPLAGEQEQLGLSENEPVFIIERTTWLSDQAVTHVRLVHPANSFRLVTRDQHGGAI
ncbi:UTRA domain-containing protein [Hoeflea sp. TYP-13]|uniref:UTRA domain-containing protein n=1 Tax=Hoeflea sp. TYP-13 TaxID=3230023 RepID=UPI0034C679D8